MARQFRYFSGDVQLDRVWHDGAVSTKAHHFFGTTPDGRTKVQATRKIDYKLNGSKHQCDARCLNAKGHNCECACGGKNHGAG